MLDRLVSSIPAIRRRPRNSTINTITAFAGVVALTLAATTANQRLLQVKDNNGNVTMYATSSGSLAMSGTLTLDNPDYNCSSLGNGGKLTTTADGTVVCDDDSGGGGGGSVSGTGAINQLAYFIGANTLSGSDVIWSDALKRLSISGTYSGTTVYATSALRSSGSLTVEGAMSGASLYVATSLNGSGLTDCDAANQTLNWDASTGRFSCGTDTGGNFGSGNVLTIGDDRYVRTAGDTMTGALVLTPTTDTTAFFRINDADGGQPVFVVDTTDEEVGIGIANPFEDFVIYKDSPTLSMHGTGISGNAEIFFGDSLDSNGGRITYNYSTDALDFYTTDTLRMRMSGSMVKIYGTASGSHIHAEKTLSSSGSLVWEGSASGAVLWLSDLVGYAVDFDNIKSDDFGVFSCIQGVGCLFDPDTVSSSTIADDSVGTTELDDDSNTPAAGAFVIVETGDASFDYLSPNAGTDVTADLEEESHASEHNEGGGDALTVESLASSCTDAQVIGGNGSGGAECQADANTTYAAGEGLSLLSTSFSLADSISGTLLEFQTVSGSLVWGKTLRSSGSLVFEGAASGSSLYLGTKLEGAGLTDCDADGQTLAWDATTGRFSCGDDDSGAGSTPPEVGTSSFSGGVLIISDPRYVNVAGDTMTGALTINLTSGTIGLEVIQTISGSTIRANNELTSSGSLAVEGAAVIGGNLTAGDFICASAGCIGATELGTDSVSADELNATGVESELEGVLDHDDLQGYVANEHIDWTQASAGTIHATNYVDNNTTYTAGHGLQLVGTQFRTAANLTGSLVRGINTLASSGTLVVEGAMSGASLYVGTSINGAGLSDCDGATQTLSWDTSTGRFGCGTDADTTYTFGHGLTTNGTAISLSATHSGAVIWATTSLRSSGSLVFEGAASGSSLYLGTKLEGAGLTDCDADGQTVSWDATTGRFGCGDDDSGSATPEVGTASFTGAVFRVISPNFILQSGDTMSGALNIILTGGVDSSIALEVPHTMSGRIVYAEKTLRSSGSLVTEGATVLNSTLDVIGNSTFDGTTMFIDASSNEVGIGTITPDAKLDVLGTISGSLVAQNGAGNNFFQGNIGVGTTSPDAKLDVIGTISGSSVVSITAVSPLHLGAQWTESGSAVTTGTGKVIFQVPVTASGFNVVGAYVSFRTAGTTNVNRFSLTNVDKGNRHIFTTPFSVDSGETNTLTAATPFVVNATNDDVGGGDRLSFNVNSVSTTAPKGGTVIVILRKP